MSTAIAKNFQVGSDGTATNNFTIRQPATPDGTVRIANGNSGTTTDLVTVTSAGNVGVGVTPSAWNSAVRAIELLSPGSAIYGLSGGTTVTAGAYIDSVGWKYSVSGVPITRYDQGAFASGQHTWFNAASGTAGNAISWTQAMTLDSSGRLLVGTTSNLGGAGQFAIDQSGGSIPAIHLIGTQGVGGGGRETGATFSVITNDTGPAYSNVAKISAAKENATQGNTAGYMAFSTTPNGGSLTERARIDSSGNLLVGTTSGPSPSNKGFGVLSNGSAGKYIANAVSITSNCSHIEFYNPNGVVGSILTNGSTTSYNTSSDYRLKENIQPMTGALAKVAALKPCTYTWKADGSAGEGFIAHELQEICPSAVTGEKDAVNEDGLIKPQGIDTSFLVATLAAAIQELKAEFDSVKTELALLKGTV